MPPCISANSFCPSSLEMHFNLTPLSLLLYSSLSTNWYILDCLVIFSISSGSSGSSPVCRKRTISCAHAGARGSTAKTKGMKAAAGPRLPRQEPLVPSELVIPRQACRGKACREPPLQLDRSSDLQERTVPQRSDCRFACRGKACRGHLLQLDGSWDPQEQDVPRCSGRCSWGPWRQS